MKVLVFGDDAGAPVGEAGSARATVSLVWRGEAVRVRCVRLGPDGVLGRHSADSPQLFVVVQGSGVVVGGSGEAAVGAGDAAFWDAGEEREARSDGGLTAIVIESDRLGPG